MLSANASRSVAVSSTATRRKEMNYRNALREDRKAWMLAAGPASAAKKAKNNHVLWTSVTALQKLPTQDCRQFRELSCLASQKLQQLICHIYNYCTVVLTEYDQHCGGREERKSTLPPWLTPFMVMVMHQRKGRLLDRAKLPFSREHSPALKALLLSLSFHSDPTQPEELHPVHSPPRTSSHLLRHPEKGEGKEAGGGEY